LSSESVDSSATVNITAYTDKKQQAVVPCSYQWFIIKNGVPQEVPDFRGSSFICETSHIGYYLQAHITVSGMICRAMTVSTAARPSSPWARWNWT
jgi:hypothetical protein